MTTKTPRRIYPDYTYTRAPIERCYWAEAVPEAALAAPPLPGPARVEALVIGGGYTGLNAALSLAQAGRQVTLIDAAFPAFGASGRNGGFCCLGSARASDGQLRRRFGPEAPADLRRAEAASIAHVDRLTRVHGIDVDRHSTGETILAHSPKAMEKLAASAESYSADYGTEMRVLSKADLAIEGLDGPTWYGGLHNPLGFALHPRKYAAGLLRAALAAGVTVHGETPALAIEQQGRTLSVTTPRGTVTADRVLVATNGYTAENLAPWFRGRTLPAQSSAIASRPLTEAEMQAQGYWSRQMAYEDRRLLHYFHLTPDGRMVFGQRGGLLSSPATEAKLAKLVRADFDRAFPAWSHVETPHYWSGMVCLTASLTPYCGPVPGLPGAFTAFGYHGNGVAMGSYLGARMAELARDEDPSEILPASFRAPPPRFPLGRFRRLLLAAEYTQARLFDL
ncbi:Gamma-glutamylputrescine oxidoreductase [Pseudooceanicola marinus]|uniref:Gamma-glutamylputrescine oxidoreductase n=1 Tax=Pseudooceanicola marinus TaxID=396013 RepID=A0A1X7A4X4_9RHOB|nr:FAD-binding oxidoreductase [Pseudooceanicola marinus]PJE31202.1 FAD-binding oxidoreductase [Pseudooceanicola marinus]SLN68706.1 Gamma-glutamylputrescine oxidoreductase [Pseudooceanicola marinus]